ALDPGEHNVHFEVPSETRDVHIVVPEGQKNRAVLADFEEKKPSSPQTAVSFDRVETSSSQRTLGFVVAGAGLASLTVAGISALLALNAKGDTACGPPCYAVDPNSGAPNARRAKALDAYDRANTLAWVSNVTLGVGVIALAIGAYLIWTA